MRDLPLGARYGAQVLGVAAVYWAAARIGLSIAFVNRQITAVWPPTGIALAVVLLLGFRLWPGIALGAFLANAQLGSTAAACGIAAGNTLEALSGAFLLRRFAGFDPALERLRDVFALLFFCALLSTMISASIGVVSLGLAGMPRIGFRDPWSVWWLGDALGALVVAPAILTWAKRPRLPWRGRRLAELALLFATLLLVGDAVLSHYFIKDFSRPMQFLMFPFLIWSAVRFSQSEVAAVTIVVSGLAIRGALHGVGSGGLNESLNTTQLFMGVFALTALVLGAATAERRTAEAVLRKAHDELESRVAQRTVELAKTNAELIRNKEEMESFVHAISHDLRGPLVNIQGFSRELALSCRGLDEQAGAIKGLGEALRFINASVERAQHLIGALLDFSRAGRQSYRFHDLDMSLLVAATLDSLQKCLRESRARVELGALPRAFGDPVAVAQVFSNLIENAARYLKPDRPGLIEIAGEAHDGMSHYWVKDNGLGIAESDKPRLFRVFQRLRPDAAPGEGIGLAIVKRIIDRHGGKVWVESREGDGSTFHLTLREAQSAGCPQGGKL